MFNGYLYNSVLLAFNAPDIMKMISKKKPIKEMNPINEAPINVLNPISVEKLITKPL